MDSYARCWLVVAAVSPLAAAFSFWSLITLQVYRRQWRTLDVLFVAAVSQEFVHSLFLLAHSVLNLTKPNVASLCSLFLWATVSLRTFQLATLTSLALDRAFTLVWPSQYPLIVRRHLVCYHLVVMAIVSSLVGAASVFAQNTSLSSDIYTCFLLPFDSDPKFAIFLVTLHAVLAVVSFGSLLYVQLKLCFPPIYSSPPSTITTTSTSGVDRIRILNKHYLIANGMINASPQTSDRNRQRISNSSLPMRRGAACSIKEFRWGAVLPIIFICHFVNHFPFMVMVILARFTHWISPLWLEGGSTYLALVQALLLPALLWGIDPVYKTAVTHTLVRTKNVKKECLHGYLDDGSRMFNERYPHSLPTSNFDTALAYSTFVCGSETLDKKELLLQSNEGSRWGTATQDELSALNSFYNPQLPVEHSDNRIIVLKCNSFQSPEPVYCDPAEMMENSVQLTKSSHGYAAAAEDHIYATVSDRYDKSTLSVKGDPRRLCQEIENFDVNDDNSSVTTSASDDFEFHLTRPHVVTHAAQNFSGEAINKLRCSVMNHQQFLKEPKKMNKSSATEFATNATPSTASTLSIRSKSTQAVQNSVVNNDYINKPESLPKKPKNSSLSMNDLDLLSKETHGSSEELIYVLTGKSESCLSLYKITPSEDLETLDRPLFRCVNPNTTPMMPAKLHLNSTWSFQERESPTEWESTPIEQEQPKQTVTTLDHFVTKPVLPYYKKSKNSRFYRHYHQNNFRTGNQIHSSGSKAKFGSINTRQRSNKRKYPTQKFIDNASNVSRQEIFRRGIVEGNESNVMSTSAVHPNRLISIKKYFTLNDRCLATFQKLKSKNATKEDDIYFQKTVVSDFL